MKIGILTLHYGYNYGGVLQCYALQSYIKSLGHEVEVINYIPTHRSNIVKKSIAKLKTIDSLPALFHNIKDYVKTALNQSNKDQEQTQKFSRIFDNFRYRCIVLSPRVDENTIVDFADRYDAVIVGSDQVWTSLYDSAHVYFFDWLSQKSHVIKISYAACSAHAFVQGKTQNTLSILLNRMQAIGVRDMTTAALVKSANPNLVPVLVADPTLLYDFADFVDEPTSDSYILTYILGTEISSGHKAVIGRIKEHVGDFKVISIILPNSASGIETVSDEVVQDASPEKWVSLFRKASAIYTDSFHGVMFSIKFKKPFFAYYENAIRASRLIDLKERYCDLPIYRVLPKVLNMNYKSDFTDLISQSRLFIISNLQD